MVKYGRLIAPGEKELGFRLGSARLWAVLGKFTKASEKGGLDEL